MLEFAQRQGDVMPSRYKEICVFVDIKVFYISILYYISIL
jgi:hypothetical protein